MSCPAFACGAPLKRDHAFCPKHAKMASLGRGDHDPERVKVAVIAIARSEGYLAPDPVVKRGRPNLVHRTQAQDDAQT